MFIYKFSFSKIKYGRSRNEIYYNYYWSCRWRFTYSIDFKVIGELAHAMGVKTIFHGHLHENYIGIIKNNIKVCGVADAAVSDLQGNKLT